MEQQPASDAMSREQGDQPDRELARLTARMRSNEEEAYRTFYLRYFDRLFRYLLVVTGGSEQQAKDALQDTLVRVVNHIKEFESEEAFWGWLTLLARSALKDQHRKTSRYSRALERFFTQEQPGLATLYGSTTDTIALEECKANDRYYGVTTKSPRLLVAIEARLTRVLDLTNPAIRRALDLTLQELAAEDWRKLLAAGRESLTQVVGRAVAAVGGSGLVARSAAVKRGVNVIIFRGARAADRLQVVEGDKLDAMGVDERARAKV
jgi:RNA polymerase sigma factor (sigma-70 family)